MWPSGNLQIAEVRRSDEGQYKCITENPVSGQLRVSEHVVHLEVMSEYSQEYPQFPFSSLLHFYQVYQGYY